MKPISERAAVLLHFVDEATVRDWSTGELKRFFVPSAEAYHYWDNGRMESTYISGSGDASAFRGLVARGLIERPRTTIQSDYCYALTEEGLQYLEQSGLRGRFSS